MLNCEPEVIGGMFELSDVEFAYSGVVNFYANKKLQYSKTFSDKKRLRTLIEEVLRRNKVKNLKTLIKITYD